jgi:nucleotide-binding universal stress UspA family protein
MQEILPSLCLLAFTLFTPRVGWIFGSAIFILNRIAGRRIEQERLPRAKLRLPSEGCFVTAAHHSKPSNGADRQPAGPELKRVLVPVDFSVCTIEALQHARGIAGRFNALIDVLHIVPANHIIARREPELFCPELIQAMSDAARGELKKLVGILWENEVDATVTVRKGKADEVIVREAVALEATLIVMGTSGRSRLPAWFRRNTVQRVIQNAPCPVLVIRAGMATNQKGELFP